MPFRQYESMIASGIYTPIPPHLSRLSRLSLGISINDDINTNTPLTFHFPFTAPNYILIYSTQPRSLSPPCLLMLMIVSVSVHSSVRRNDHQHTKHTQHTSTSTSIQVTGLLISISYDSMDTSWCDSVVLNFHLLFPFIHQFFFPSFLLPPPHLID
jgi:hypothetical protein